MGLVGGGQVPPETELKRPLVALLIAGVNAHAAVVTREKAISIREGWRDYQVGDTLALICHIDPFAVLTKVTDMRHTTLGEVTEQEYQNDGFASYEELLAGLQQFYPDITYDSPVTVIRWETIEEGYFFDHKEEWLAWVETQNA